MPGPAFVPAQLEQAEGRTWRNLYPRQARGLAWGCAGGVVGALLWGLSTPAGFVATAALALPGFAYGFYQPAGRPLEWWLRVTMRYYTTPQVATVGARSLRRPAAPARLRRTAPKGGDPPRV